MRTRGPQPEPAPVQQRPVLPLIGPAIPVQPAPCSLTIEQVKIGAEDAVLMQVSTPVGVAFYFLTPDMAAQASELLAKAGKASSAGIILVR